MSTIISRFRVLITILGSIIVLSLPVACIPASSPSPVHAGTPKPGEILHLVVLGDSQMWDVGIYYAKYLEADLGVKVVLDDYWKGLTMATQLLDDLKAFDVVRNVVKQANVVILHTNPAGTLGWRMATFQASDKYDCSDQALAGYQADLDAIFTEIFALRKGQPTMIRVMGNYANFYALSEWQRLGKYDEYKRCADAANAIYSQTAVKHNLNVADVSSAFNGPNHDQDPRDKGYLLEDNQHPSNVGRQVIADQFRKLGYEYIIP